MPEEIIIPEEHLIDINTEKCHICGVSCSGAFPVLSLENGMVFVCSNCDDKIFEKGLEEHKLMSIDIASL